MPTFPPNGICAPAGTNTLVFSTNNTQAGSVDSAQGLSWVGGVSALSPGSIATWLKVVIPYTSLQTAGLTNTVPVYLLPTNGVVHAAYANVTTLFSGGAIATIVATLGIGGTVAKYMASSSMASTGGVAGTAITAPAPESLVGTTQVNLYAISTVANLSALTQGSITVWMLVSVLP